MLNAGTALLPRPNGAMEDVVAARLAKRVQTGCLFEFLFSEIFVVYRMIVMLRTYPTVVMPLLIGFASMIFGGGLCLVGWYAARRHNLRRLKSVMCLGVVGLLYVLWSLFFMGRVVIYLCDDAGASNEWDTGYECTVPYQIASFALFSLFVIVGVPTLLWAQMLHRRISLAMDDGPPVVRAPLREVEVTVDDKADEAAEACIICYDEPRNTVFMDCGHIAACAKCARQVSQCPVCRASIASLIVRTSKIPRVVLGAESWWPPRAAPADPLRGMAAALAQRSLSPGPSLSPGQPSMEQSATPTEIPACGACGGRRPRVMAMPCGHLGGCPDCAARTGRCHACQKHIERVVQVYSV